MGGSFTDRGLLGPAGFFFPVLRSQNTTPGAARHGATWRHGARAFQRLRSFRAEGPRADSGRGPLAGILSTSSKAGLGTWGRREQGKLAQTLGQLRQLSARLLENPQRKRPTGYTSPDFSSVRVWRAGLQIGRIGLHPERSIPHWVLAVPTGSERTIVPYD